MNTKFSQELSSELTSPSQIVLGYTTAVQSPDYLQLYVLDKLTDSGWSLFSQPGVDVPGQPAAAHAARAHGRVAGRHGVTTITIARDVGPDDLNALPAPYPTTSIKAKGDLEADRSTLMLFDQGTRPRRPVLPGHQPRQRPLGQALDIAPPPPAVIKDHYLEVPASYDSLRALAESIVSKAGAKTPFEKAVALQDWLADGNFKYTLKAPTCSTRATAGSSTHQERLLPAVRLRDGGARPAARHPVPGRLGFTAGTPVGNDDGRSPPMTRTPGRSCTSGLRVAAFRAHPRRRHRPGNRLRPTYPTCRAAFHRDPPSPGRPPRRLRGRQQGDQATLRTTSASS